eukprot:44743-Hanusia_phi.AAC.1
MKEAISTCNDGKKRLGGMLRGIAHTMLGDLLLGWGAHELASRGRNGAGSGQMGDTAGALRIQHHAAAITPSGEVTMGQSVEEL